MSGHQFVLLFTATICLTTLPTATAQPAAAERATVKVIVDVTEVPDLASWADEAKKLVETWYPRVVEILAAEERDPPEIKLVFKRDMRGVAATSGTTITIAAPYVQGHRDDLGMIVHELTHVVQAYPKTEAPWLVEGIADYVRCYHYEPQTRLPPIDPARQSYRDGYKIAAMFLAWIEKNHGKNVVPELNRALRRGAYRYDLFKQLTGKSLDRLWADFLEDAAARGR